LPSGAACGRLVNRLAEYLLYGGVHRFRHLRTQWVQMPIGGIRAAFRKMASRLPARVSIAIDIASSTFALRCAGYTGKASYFAQSSKSLAATERSVRFGVE
jgi:hypothetical protein